uniref:hypothetical protein n=1 Tax=Flavobacterium sp. TaxID=239 RepID=UPI00404A2103
MSRLSVQNSKKLVKIKDVANKTGFSEQVIINILKDAGFYIPSDVTFFILNKKHLTVLSSYYVDAVKQLFTNTKRNHQSLKHNHLEQLRNFFAHFIHSSNNTFGYFNHFQSISVDDVFDSKLDNDLIKLFFFRIVYSVPNQSTSNNFGYVTFRISRSINSMLRNVNNDLRAKIHTIISKHYHIFTDEENHISFANSNFSISFMKNLRDAAFNYLKFNLKHKLICQNIHHLQEI